MLCALNNSICAQDFVISGNTYESVKSTSSVVNEITTPYTFKIKDVEYPIFLSKNGCAYIKRISAKSGQEYKQYLSAEISKNICAKMNIEYKGK